MNSLDSFDKDLLPNEISTEESDDSDNDFYGSLEATEESEDKNTDNKYELPFDPKLIKITVEVITVYGITEKLRNDSIDLYPNFQRKVNLWDDVRKSRLIESLLLRFPLPAFYFDIENEDKWLVVDGLQRLSTLKHFIVDINDPLKLTGLEILQDLEGRTFRQLDVTFRQRILNTNLTTFQIQAGTPKVVKYNIFKRINTGGLGLVPMEIRHALNQNGIATVFFQRLTNEENSFFNAFITENKVPTLRMEDRELILRYVAFSLKSYEDYQPTLGSFLDNAMEELDASTEETSNLLIENLKKAINCYKAIFENSRFGRGFTLKAKTNSALFEAWTSELARLSDEDRERLVQRKNEIKEDYRNLLSNPLFNKSIVSSTAGKGAVQVRFASIRSLLNKFKQNNDNSN